MSNTGTRNTTRKKTASSAVTPEVKATDVVKEKTEFSVKDIDVNQYVTVINGFNGTLVYVSSRTGETFEWDGLGAEQEMELRELKSAKNSAKAFFSNNWWMFNEDWITQYLGVSTYYRWSIPIEEIDGVFELSGKELEEVLSNTPEGQKKTIAYRAKEKIANGEIDSLSAISALEKYLGITLIER